MLVIKDLEDIQEELGVQGAGKYVALGQGREPWLKL